MGRKTFVNLRRLWVNRLRDQKENKKAVKQRRHQKGVRPIQSAKNRLKMLKSRPVVGKKVFNFIKGVAHELTTNIF